MNYKALWGTTAVIGIAAISGPALAIDAKTSGHLNRAIMWADDGRRSETFFVDGEPSNTRFRFVGSETISKGVTAGVNFEVEWVSNNSSDVTLDNRDPGTELNERHMDTFVAGDFGKFSLGQGDGAANGGAEVDLSGTAIVNYSGVTDIGSSIAFQDNGTAGPTIGQTTSNLDFESRYDRLRYDTPTFGVATIAVAFGTTGGNDVADLAVRFNSDFDGAGKLAAAIGFSTEDKGGATGDEETTGGSISWLADSGLNLTAAVSMRDNNAGLDASFNYFKIGYRYDMHAVSLDFASAEDQVQAGDEADMIGVGYVYTPIKWAEFYAGYKVHSLDRTGSNFDDISILTGGTRLKFF